VVGRTRGWSAGCVLLLFASVSWGQCGPGGTPFTNPTLAPAGAFPQTAPHLTSGAFGSGGFLSKLTIVNLAATTNSVVVNDISQAGTLIDSCAYSVAPNGTLRLTQPTNGSFTGASETHWAIVGSSAPVGVNLFFELTQNNTVVNTVGFNDLTPRTNFTFPVEMQGTPFHTLGLAVANPNNTSNTVTVNLVDSTGKTLGTRQETLPAYGQLAEGLNGTTGLGLASVLPAGDFIGSIVVTTSSPAVTVGVGDDQGPFFSEAPMFIATPSGGSANLSTTVALSPSDPATTVGSGSCSIVGVPLTGARSTMTIAASPASDPIAAGYANVLWNAWVDSNDHVSLELCKFASGTAFLSSSLTFNIRALTSSQPSSIAALTVPAGSNIPNVPHTNNPQCLRVTASVPAATSSTSVVLTPTADPANIGWNDVQWRGYIAAPGQVGALLCKVGGQAGTSTAALNFNVALLN
jgi:hypothetical protein